MTMVALTLAFSFDSAAENNPQAQNDDWKDRVKSQKIAFITSEVGLTSAEAQVFWPVYNQLEEEQQKIFHKVGDSFKELEKALNEKASEAEVSSRLQAYTKALEQRSQFESSMVSRYAGVISKEKIAKLYVAEEKFRRQQIHKLHSPQQQKPSGNSDDGNNAGRKSKSN